MENQSTINKLELIAQTVQEIARSARKVNASLVKEKGIEYNQQLTHGFAWYATYAETITQTVNWIKELNEKNTLTDYEMGIAKIGVGEYCLQVMHGIPMSQSEIIRPHEIGVQKKLLKDFKDICKEITNASSSENRQKLSKLIWKKKEDGISANIGLDETYNNIKEQFSRFTNERIIPHAHRWHLNNELIPLEIIKEMADLGVFALTIPKKYEGLGLDKKAMCIVSEELSRGWIGTGSLGTRSEIAAELILNAGTNKQKEKYLSAIAKGEVLPTAVFTEPDIGSDLAHLKTRAKLDGKIYKIFGNKTWITHGARADLMTLLVRTNQTIKDHNGLSMLLAEKTRGSDRDPFPDSNITGSEINVIGYRGMKEYDIAFEGFEVTKDNLLGEKEGLGFKQLMTTFESARIQTAARAVGVSQSACDLALNYSLERTQFGKKLIEFSRISEKITMMFCETMMARQLTLYAARIKDTGQRCDMEAGMAKLLASRIAWSAADNALQIHGGIGFATETPISRILADARILSIFEGTAEIQAQVIAKRLIETDNR